MVAHRKSRRLAVSVLALAVSAGILLGLAGVALALPADARHRAAHGTTAPVVRENLVAPDRGPDTLALVFIGLGACAALVGAGYLGARIALRLRLPNARPGHPSRTRG